MLAAVLPQVSVATCVVRMTECFGQDLGSEKIPQPREFNQYAAPRVPCESRPLGLGNSRKSADRLSFREQLVGRFGQMPRGVLSIWQMPNQLSGKFVNVDAFEVVELLSRGIEDSRATDDRDVDATAIKYFSVHGWPPIVACEGRQRLRLLVRDSEENRNSDSTSTIVPG